MFLRQDEETGSLHQPGPCELGEGSWLSRQTPGIHVSTLLMLGLQKCATMLGLLHWCLELDSIFHGCVQVLY